MSLNKLTGLAVCMCSLAVLAACSSTSGNASLNTQALTAYAASSAKSNLTLNRERLGACIAHEAALQRLGGAPSVDAPAIAENCESYELAYRTSVMAHVRPEWQNADVLSNTANSATRNLYATILELF